MPWTKLAMAGLLAAALAGCGGGSDGTNGTNGTNGANGQNGQNGQDLTAQVDATKLASASWLALKPTIDPASVTVSIPADGKPVVTFKVADDKGLPVVGLGGQIAGTATALPSNYNLQFTMAKLVPSANGEPSKWVSYLVTKPGTITAGAVATWAGAFPQADTNGTLVDNQDGTYKYTFLHNITAVQGQVNGLTDSPSSLDGKNLLKADLDPANLNYDAAATHRLGIIIQGSQPGTGTNTPTKVQVTDPVPLLNTFNMGCDFLAATGKCGVGVTVTRDIVVKSSCASCHDNRAIGHISTNDTSPTAGIPAGNFVGRNDPRLCVTCHTDQTKYGFVEVTKTATGYDDTSANGYKRVNGQAAFTYPRMIHQTHMGENLVKTGYNLNAHAKKADGTTGCDATSSRKGQCYNLVRLPQLPSDCTVCHDGSATKSDGSVNANKTANGDNWKNNPSIIACGACHDGINFTTGTGVTLADKAKDEAAGVPVGTTQSGHAGFAQADSSNCASCHRPGFADISVLHRSTTPTLNNPVVKAGVSTIVYDLKSVTLNSLNQPKVEFKITKDGAVVTSLATPAPAIAGLTKGPSLYVAYGVSQDGVTAPADFNGRVGASLDNVLNGTQGSITGPVNGYFTATLTGTSTAPIAIPAGATMVTGLMVGRFEQVVGGVTVKIKPMLKTVLATIAGNTPRRVIVALTKCNSCHDQLGTSPEFHNGERNDPTACAICHNPNEINDGGPNNFGWPGATNTYIHGIHAASKRTYPFTWAAWEFNADDNVSDINYPGLLKDCNQCHLPNTVNFGANGVAVTSHLFPTTAAAGNSQNASTVWGVSPWVAQTVGTSYGNVAKVSSVGAVTPADGTTLVNSPIASACFACHDTSSAKGHMESNGGTIYRSRAEWAASGKGEACLVCHGAGKDFDVAAVHGAK